MITQVMQLNPPHRDTLIMGRGQRPSPESSDPSFGASEWPPEPSSVVQAVQDVSAIITDSREVIPARRMIILTPTWQVAAGRICRAIPTRTWKYPAYGTGRQGCDVVTHRADFLKEEGLDFRCRFLQRLED